MTEPRYTYEHYNPFAGPGAYADSYRIEEYEKEDIDYAILQPNPPYDDDSMLVRWNKNYKQWVINFAIVIRGGRYPTGREIQNKFESGERAALVLLGHFGLEKRANDFTPEEIGHMSPSVLETLAKDLYKNAPPNP